MAKVLSDRRQRVLKALIEEYIAYAQPVGSRTLVDRYHLGVSSATVRNELSVLEDEGYLRSPHTSAGRVPTDFGYRAFVDDLLDREYGEEADGKVFDELRDAATELDDLMDRTSAQLARMTDCLSIVLAPSVLGMSVKQVTLVSLSSHRAMLVIVTDDGQVLNRAIEFADEVKPEALSQVQNALNAMIGGKSVADVRNGAAGPLPESLSSPLARLIIEEMLLCLNEGDAGRAHRLGISSLFKKPEFSQSQAALPVLQVLEDDTVLMQLFDEVAQDEGAKDDLRVSIGSENSEKQLSGISVVAAQYGEGDGAGIIAVIGPTRMDYENVIKVVRAAKSALRNL